MALCGVDTRPVEPLISTVAGPEQQQGGGQQQGQEDGGPAGAASSARWHLQHLWQEPTVVSGLWCGGWGLGNEGGSAGKSEGQLISTLMPLCSTFKECTSGVLGLLKAVLLRLGPDNRKASVNMQLPVLFCLLRYSGN
eukprot:evm.model.scf_1145EXC.4 EVM.evm.TU.scf_1145EXC.4   scf_1145EXC:21910-22323(-)